MKEKVNLGFVLDTTGSLLLVTAEQQIRVYRLDMSKNQSVLISSFVCSNSVGKFPRFNNPYIWMVMGDKSVVVLELNESQRVICEHSEIPGSFSSLSPVIGNRLIALEGRGVVCLLELKNSEIKELVKRSPEDNNNVNIFVDASTKNFIVCEVQRNGTAHIFVLAVMDLGVQKRFILNQSFPNICAISPSHDHYMCASGGDVSLAALEPKLSVLENFNVESGSGGNLTDLIWLSDSSLSVVSDGRIAIFQIRMDKMFFLGEYQGLGVLRVNHLGSPYVVIVTSISTEDDSEDDSVGFQLVKLPSDNGKLENLVDSKRLFPRFITPIVSPQRLLTIPLGSSFASYERDVAFLKSMLTDSSNLKRSTLDLYSRMKGKDCKPSSVFFSSMLEMVLKSKQEPMKKEGFMKMTISFLLNFRRSKGVEDIPNLSYLLFYPGVTFNLSLDLAECSCSIQDLRLIARRIRTLTSHNLSYLLSVAVVEEDKILLDAVVSQGQPIVTVLDGFEGDCVALVRLFMDFVLDCCTQEKQKDEQRTPFGELYTLDSIVRYGMEDQGRLSSLNGRLFEWCFTILGKYFIQLAFSDVEIVKLVKEVCLVALDGCQIDELKGLEGIMEQIGLCKNQSEQTRDYKTEIVSFTF